MVSGKKWLNTTNKTNKPLIKNNQNESRETTMASVDYFQRKLDDKRRLTIPAEVRAEFISGVVITRGFGQYLHLYPKSVWDDEVEAALKSESSILDEKIADLNVQFRRGKTEATLDQKQGRVMIEQHLLDYAKIDHELEAVRAGAYWRIMASDDV
jgi:MraZ protein